MVGSGAINLWTARTHLADVVFGDMAAVSGCFPNALIFKNEQERLPITAPRYGRRRSRVCDRARAGRGTTGPCARPLPAAPIEPPTSSEAKPKRPVVGAAGGRTSSSPA